MLILNVLQGPDKGRRFELPDNEPQLIGRSSESLPLHDPTISRRHAELTPDNGKWFINDLRSANGTYVNGVQITGPTLLRSGDQVRTGSTLFVFGRVTDHRTDSPVRVLQPEQMDASVETSVPSSDDSVIMAVPEPSAEATRQLKVIYELMQIIGTEFDRSVLLERVMDLIFEHVQADRGFILIQTELEAEPRPVVVRYRRKPRLGSEGKIPVSHTIVQYVMERAEGVLSSSAMTDKRFASGDSVAAYGIHSVICVPVKFRDTILGVIHIDSQIANYTFTSDQLRLVTEIGVQTGMALKTAEMYQQGVQHARLVAVGETVASLSHAIRNILQGMRGGAEVVELGMRKNDFALVRNGWDILSRNLDRIYELTMNMLAYSKQRKPELDMVQLPSVLEEVVDLIQPQCDRQTVALVTECERDMPPIPADAGGLHQAIMNLLNNALEAVEPGEGIVTLRCHYEDARHKAVIVVGDNGSGINPDSMGRIFAPFYSTKGQRGTGLGLAVAKKVIDEHGGAIDVDSRPDRGTTFTIILPTETLDDPAATAT